MALFKGPIGIFDHLVNHMRDKMYRGSVQRFISISSVGGSPDHLIASFQKEQGGFLE